ncbi:S-adenosyl-L-methionine-dependent methyltransferase, partial [Amylocystis lapponica]
WAPEFTSPVLTLLNAQPGERIIDFGCGTGEVTRKIKQAVGDTGLVVGVDSSQSMIDKSKTDSIDHAFVSDVQDLQFPSTWAEDLQSGFDAVFSNATLHWCKRDPKGVLENAKRVLKPGGRFVVEMGGFMNCVGVRVALYHVLRSRGYDPAELDPWYFPSPGAYTSLLESAGFDVQSIALHPRLTPLNGSLYDWLRLFARSSSLGGLCDTEADAIMREVEDMCSVDFRDEQGNWTVMYCRLRVVAFLK